MTDEKDLVRDKATGALINTNVKALKMYKMKKKRAEEAKDLQKQVNELKTDIDDIKNMLHQLLKKE